MLNPTDRRSGLTRLLGPLLACGALATVASCAAIEQPLRSDLVAASADTQQCAAWFTKLDRIVEEAGVGDGEAFRIPGFPHLRVNRFVASFRQQARGDGATFAAWEGHMRGLDARARGYEFDNLPQPAIAKLGEPDRASAIAHTERCATLLVTLDIATPARQALLAEQAVVPDDYADWKRVVGLYPLVKLPFFEFAKGWQNEAEGMFKQTAAGNAEQQKIHRYGPSARPVAAAAVAKIFANLKSDALGIPQLSQHDGEILADAFAPVYEVDTTGDYDLPGALRWGAGIAPELDFARPTVYRRVAFTRYGGRTLVQLVYLIWFSERPDAGWMDMLSGKLDGLIFRVTLDSSGRPLIYDSIHPCGCYHMFFPTPLATPIPPPETRLEWAFIPRTLPATDLGQRLVLRLTSRSHYLTDIRPQPATALAAGSAYMLIDDGALRTLPTATGSRNVFGPDGIVPGTQRGERLLVWPLGIDDPGAMREWGRHATALVGRRHFDDADLIERRFELAPATGLPSVPRPAGN